jgi:hypothetical protein
MKKITKSFFLPLLLLFTFIILQSVKSNSFTSEYVDAAPFNSSGRATSANDGNTGAPGESGVVCATCHAGGAFGATTLTLEVRDAGNNLVTAYAAGATYSLQYTINTSAGTPGGYGFQSTLLEDSGNNNIGTFQNPGSNVKIATAANIAGGRTYIEHNGGASANNVFSIEWVAPPIGVGDVTIYTAVNAVNGTGSTGGDVGTSGDSFTLTETSLSVDEVSFQNKLKLFPNPNNGTNITIDFGGTYAEVAINVSNILGQNIHSIKTKSTNSVTLPKIDKTGLYFARISNDKGELTVVKFIIE